MVGASERDDYAPALLLLSFTAEIDLDRWVLVSSGVIIKCSRVLAATIVTSLCQKLY